MSRARRRACEAKPQIETRKVRRGDKVYEMTLSRKNVAGKAEAISPTPMAPTDALGIPVAGVVF